MDVMTIKAVSKAIGEPSRRVAYAVKRAGIIPAGRAGLVRLFTPEQVERIRGAVANLRPYIIAEEIPGGAK